MMNGAGKSDSPILPAKPANKAGRSVAEPVEGSGGTKRNAELQSTVRTQSRDAVSQAQDRIREAVNRNKKGKFTALLHHVDIDVLRWAFFSLKKRAAPGVDGVTWGQYEEDLETRLTGLHARVHAGTYRALPSRRRLIPKTDGRYRTLGIAAIEDKIVQAAVVAILTPIYEAEFLGFSYGFRPGRSQHDALDALAYGIKTRKICWILDSDIQSFFDQLSREWLVRFVEYRIGDRRIIRLIQKWLTAGVLEEGRRIETTAGTPQGSVASPLLANAYLHYVYDLWVQQWRERHATGDMIVVRYCDDSIVGFQHRQDAERFLNDLRERLGKFALNLHPEKTRLIEFGRHAAEDRASRGDGRPEAFDFLGLTHICGTKKDGKTFQLWRRSQRKRFRVKLKDVKVALRRRSHLPLAEQGAWLATVVRGYFAYHAVPTNFKALCDFRRYAVWHWYRALRRRSQRWRRTWQWMRVLANRYLPSVRILHPWPEQRFHVQHSR
ncbi:MAG: group II intron reverse transcriptase/maturase [Steroidobacteraceae bacterium]